MSNDIIEIESFKAGQKIFQEGELGRTAFLVREGRIKIFRTAKGGKLQIIGAAGPGQIFGEHALLAVGVRQSSAMAEVPAKCVVIHRDKLKDKLKTEDPFVAALYNILATNMRSMIDQGADLDCLLQELSEGTRTLDSAKKQQPKKSTAPPPPQSEQNDGDGDGEDDDEAFLI